MAILSEFSGCCLENLVFFISQMFEIFNGQIVGFFCMIVLVVDHLVVFLAIVLLVSLIVMVLLVVVVVLLVSRDAKKKNIKSSKDAINVPDKVAIGTLVNHIGVRFIKNQRNAEQSIICFV